MPARHDGCFLSSRISLSAAIPFSAFSHSCSDGAYRGERASIVLHRFTRFPPYFPAKQSNTGLYLAVGRQLSVENVSAPHMKANHYLQKITLCCVACSTAPSSERMWSSADARARTARSSVRVRGTALNFPNINHPKWFTQVLPPPLFLGTIHKGHLQHFWDF